MEKLNINSNDGFLHLPDLPYNCIFNKVITGCGGTTIVLNNDQNYVIAVPTTELIVNKCASTKNIFGLYGKFDVKLKQQLKDYIAKDGVKKIMCTYDKLPKLAEYINTDEYRLLIDEYHSLLKAYSYRDEAIDGVLNSFKAYKSYCFMSATPISVEFKPALLDAIPEIVANWNHTDTLKVKLEQTNKPFVKAANIINAYKMDGYITIDGIKSYEAFFFINSVTDIKAILDHCKLSNDEVRIICADNDKNRKKLDGYEISNSNTENKMFNFITSKSFEGVDYFSQTGMCFVVSSASNPHTLASIDTDIPQIAGRIRSLDNPFRNKIIHIYNTTLRKLNLEVSYEEIAAKTTKGIKDAKDTADYFNNAPENVKDKLRTDLKSRLNSMYMSYDSTNDLFNVNDILPKLELYNYKLNKEIYSSGLAISKAYNNNGIATTDVNWEKVDEDIDRKISSKLSFKDAFLKYSEMKTSLSLFDENKIAEIQPLVIPAFHKLGVEKVRKLRYTVKDVKAELIAIDQNKNIDSKIAIILAKEIKSGEFVSNKDAKQLIRTTYDQLDIKDTPKATDITKWFDCEPTSKRVDGKKINGYNIYRCNIIFKTTE